MRWFYFYVPAHRTALYGGAGYTLLARCHTTEASIRALMPRARIEGQLVYITQRPNSSASSNALARWRQRWKN